MKKIRKIGVIMLILTLSAVMVISCSKPKLTPEESTQIFLDMILKDDKSRMDKIGMTEEEYKSFREELENGLSEGMTQSTVGDLVTDEAKDNLKKDILTGLGKLEYEVVPVSTDKNTAKVEVKMKGFDFNKIIQDATEKIQTQYLANPSMTQDELMLESCKLIGAGLANGTLVEEPKSITFSLTKEDSIWVPAENDIIALMTTIMSM